MWEWVNFQHTQWHWWMTRTLCGKKETEAWGLGTPSLRRCGTVARRCLPSTTFTPENHTIELFVKKKKLQSCLEKANSCVLGCRRTSPLGHVVLGQGYTSLLGTEGKYILCNSQGKHKCKRMNYSQRGHKDLLEGTRKNFLHPWQCSVPWYRLGFTV